MANKKAIEDDEDYGDYIPPTPPHPDDLNKANLQNYTSPLAIINNEFDSKTKQPLRKPKENKEEWQFFAQLSARVQETVAKTEKELEKIKATTKVDELEKIEEKEYYFVEEIDELNEKFKKKFDNLDKSLSNKQVTDHKINDFLDSNKSEKVKILSKESNKKTNFDASNANKWVDFNQGSVEILENNINQKINKKIVTKDSEEIKNQEKLKQNLIEDFGFTERAVTPEAKTNLENIIHYEKDYLDDPFDTEYVTKKVESTRDLTEKIKKLEKELIRKPNTLDLKLNIRSHERRISESNLNQVLTKNAKYRSVPCTPGTKLDPDEIDILTTLQTGHLSRFNSRESLAESEKLISRTISASSINSILNKKNIDTLRRNSTNPFDIEKENFEDLDKNSDEEVPNVIAALTEDFCKTVTSLSESLKENNFEVVLSSNQININSKTINEINNKTEDNLEEIVEKDLNNLNEQSSIQDNKLNLNEKISVETKSECENSLNVEVLFDPFATIIKDNSISNRQSESSINKKENQISDLEDNDDVFNKNILSDLNNSSNDLNNIKTESDNKISSLNNSDSDYNLQIKSNFDSLETDVVSSDILNKTFVDKKSCKQLEEISKLTEATDKLNMQESNDDLNCDKQVKEHNMADKDGDLSNENSEINEKDVYIDSDSEKISNANNNLEINASEIKSENSNTEDKNNFTINNLENIENKNDLKENEIENEIKVNINEVIEDEESNNEIEDENKLNKEVENDNNLNNEIYNKNEFKTDNKEEKTQFLSNLSNLVVDPFDTTIYDYELIKSLAPIATKDQTNEFNQMFNSKNDKEINLDDKLDNTNKPYQDAFKSSLPQRKNIKNKENEFDSFDPYLHSNSLKNTPTKKNLAKIKKTSNNSSSDSFETSSEDEQQKYHIVIRARMKEEQDKDENLVIPLLPPPPKTPTKSPQHKIRGVYNKPLLQVGRNKAKLREEQKKLNQDSEVNDDEAEKIDLQFYANLRKQYDEQNKIDSSSLFEEDLDELEDYDKPFENLEWDFFVRYPIKKKITGNRFWKQVKVKFLPNSNTVQMFNFPSKLQQTLQSTSETNKTEPVQELLLQGSYSVSEISNQQYDQFGKIFTVKLQYTFYRERTAAEAGKKLAHNMKVMQGKLAHFTQRFNNVVNVNNVINLHNKDNFFVSTAMLQHTPIVTELIKFGSSNYNHLKQFISAIETSLFKLHIQRDRVLNYRAEEITIQMIDEYYCEINTNGNIVNHKARVRLFFLSFINGMPTVEIGINNRLREGKEIVGRNDIMPITTEEWIRVEKTEFHECVDKTAFENDDKLVKLIPPDACTIEVMRFRVRPLKNRELPLLVNAKLYIDKKKVELRVEALAGGSVSKKRDAELIPCEDIVIKVHIPECWIYFFRTEKHARFGSVKSASRKPGKIKGIERFLGATTNIDLDSSILEASVGQAKYEHCFHSLVWRIPRLPKEGQGTYKQQLMTMKLPINSSFDVIPDKFYEYVHVNFKMPATTVSHSIVRSISVSNCENPPEKYASYVAKYEYRLDLNIIREEEENLYNKGIPKSKPIEETKIEEKGSDEDYDFDDEEDEGLDEDEMEEK